ncbi:YciI family protein [Tumebacillus flagellatus]|uniref:YCII-related domain-containing protein n=1 Tax=Tumebacillus flagellatus TaxID=1157490 RepID=A0A074M731_9BACL|nr:YciI family protein [Tumebacillus flagellatus]KEO81817.1 hypothetical protein EL26_18420 [Tumebacillus flagellatus]
MSGVTEFVYVIRPVRPGFLEEVLPEEMEAMGSHFQYLQDLLEKGQLLLAGPCLDRTFGLCVFKAGSEEEAREIMENDPAIKLGVMNGELHPYRASLFAGQK